MYLLAIEFYSSSDPLSLSLSLGRLMVIGGLMPILTHIGYTVDWKQVTVITWGGLRGAVGLALALVVVQTPGIHLTIGSKVKRNSVLHCIYGLWSLRLA